MARSSSPAGGRADARAEAAQICERDLVKTNAPGIPSDMDLGILEGTVPLLQVACVTLMQSVQKAGFKGRPGQILKRNLLALKNVFQCQANVDGC